MWFCEYLKQKMIGQAPILLYCLVCFSDERDDNDGLKL